MKARIPKHREFIITSLTASTRTRPMRAGHGSRSLRTARSITNGASVYAPTFIEGSRNEVKKLQEEYGFEYTVEYVQ